MTLAFTAAPEEFAPPLAEAGATLVVFGGGTVDELELLEEIGAASASATLEGQLITLNATKLKFVNVEFRAQFTPVGPAGTILLVKILDQSPADRRPRRTVPRGDRGHRLSGRRGPRGAALEVTASLTG